MESNWVLVYVRPDCRPCEGLFRQLGGGPARGGPRRQREGADAKNAATADSLKSAAASPSSAAAAKAETRQGTYFARVSDAPRKVIFVVGGATVEEVRRMAAEHPWVPQGSWYADTDGKLAERMGLRGAPMIAGVHEGAVKWSYTGVPPQGLPIRSLMSGWHERRAAPTAPPPGAPPVKQQPQPGPAPSKQPARN